MTPLATVNVGGLSDVVQPYRALFRDRRLFTAFQAALSGILAGWYPARRATRLDVITALRTE